MEIKIETTLINRIDHIPQEIIFRILFFFKNHRDLISFSSTSKRYHSLKESKSYNVILSRLILYECENREEGIKLLIKISKGIYSVEWILENDKASLEEIVVTCLQLKNNDALDFCVSQIENSNGSSWNKLLSIACQYEDFELIKKCIKKSKNSTFIAIRGITKSVEILKWAIDYDKNLSKPMPVTMYAQSHDKIESLEMLYFKMENFQTNKTYCSLLQIEGLVTTAIKFKDIKLAISLYDKHLEGWSQLENETFFINSLDSGIEELISFFIYKIENIDSIVRVYQDDSIYGSRSESIQRKLDKMANIAMEFNIFRYDLISESPSIRTILKKSKLNPIQMLESSIAGGHLNNIYYCEKRCKDSNTVIDWDQLFDNTITRFQFPNVKVLKYCFSKYSKKKISFPLEYPFKNHVLSCFLIENNVLDQSSKNKLIPSEFGSAIDIFDPEKKYNKIIIYQFLFQKKKNIKAFIKRISPNESDIEFIYLFTVKECNWLWDISKKFSFFDSFMTRGMSYGFVRSAVYFGNEKLFDKALDIFISFPILESCYNLGTGDPFPSFGTSRMYNKLIELAMLKGRYDMLEKIKNCRDSSKINK